SCSSFSSVAQPNQPFSPLPVMGAKYSGFMVSDAPQPVTKTFQPPSLGKFLLARRVTRLGQSMDCISTLNPPCFSNCASTGGNLLSKEKSDGFIRTMGSLL